MRGATLRILTEPISSPTLLAQLADVLAKIPAARWSIWDPLNRDNVAGRETICDLSKANVIVALDSDFLYAHPHALRYARDFAAGRRVIEPNRRADEPFLRGRTDPHHHRIECRSSHCGRRKRHFAAGPGDRGRALGIGPALPTRDRTSGLDRGGRAAICRTNRGASVVIAGETQPPEVHALVAQINAALGNDGSTISPAPPFSAAGKPDPFCRAGR